MKIGLIADIHGNTVALDAVLAELDARGVDQIVHLGDLAAGGPDPCGAIDRVLSLGGVGVAGNADLDLLDPPEWWGDPLAVGAPASAVPIVEASRWAATQVGGDRRQYLASLPLTAEIDLGRAGTLLCFHGSPDSPIGTITDMTAAGDLDAMLGGHQHEIFAGGHTHVPMLRRFGGQTMVNPGSVGAPFATIGFAGEVPVRAVACFAVLETRGPVASAELVEVPVDFDALAASVAGSDMPHGEAWLDLRR